MNEQTIETVITAAREAGAMLCDYWNNGVSQAGDKASARDLVSEADRNAEQLIMRLLAEVLEGDVVVCEESGTTPGTSGRRWGIDPLDGTFNFLMGIPHWCVSIGCEDADGSLFGLVLDPLRDELFVALRGEGVRFFENGIRRDVVRPHVTELNRALVALDTAYDEKWAKHRTAIFDRLFPKVAHIRQMGSLALDMAWTSVGRFDIYHYDCDCTPWDIAQRVLLESAGLAVKVWPEGDDEHSSSILAAPPALIEEVTRLVRSPVSIYS